MKNNIFVKEYESILSIKETELAIKEAHEGKNLVGPFDTVDALWESLNAED